LWLKKYSNLPETIERLKKQGANSQKNSKTEYTLPEKIVLQYLLNKGIRFTPQYVMGEILVVDFFLHDYNCVLEVYGDYWHSNPRYYGNGENLKPLNEMQIKNRKKDTRRYYVITKNYGYYFYNIWEDEIKKDINKTMERFFKHISSKIRNESVV
jgi:very-short-patch-repair endonuclease